MYMKQKCLDVKEKTEFIKAANVIIRNFVLYYI